MKEKGFLETISQNTLVNYGLLKRVFAQTSLKEIKTVLKESEVSGLIQRHSYTGFDCFSLTSKGFEILGISHNPKLSFTKEQAQSICNTNHLRFGITKELQRYENLTLEKWVSGGKFNKSPLSVKIKGTEQYIKPEGLAVIGMPQSQKRLFFIHTWKNLEQMKHDLFVYHLYQERKHHINRFFLPQESALRVLCIIPNQKTFYWNQKQIQRSKGSEITLFITEPNTKQDNPFTSQFWFESKGNVRSII